MSCWQINGLLTVACWISVLAMWSNSGTRQKRIDVHEVPRVYTRIQSSVTACYLTTARRSQVETKVFIFH